MVLIGLKAHRASLNFRGVADCVRISADLSGMALDLTPLYDVISACRSADARQIQRNGMRLTVAIGNKRLDVVDTVTPREKLEMAGA
jgi:hypothetical protein